MEIQSDLLLSKIYWIRNQKVMLDKDLAALYGVKTKVLNQAVKRHTERFPQDFMFRLRTLEYADLRSQFVTLNLRGTHSKYLPYVFTEQGIAMLSSVINSSEAIQVNINIMRIFTKIKQVLTDYSELKIEIHELQHIVQKIMRIQEGNSKNIDQLFQCLESTQGYQESNGEKRVLIGFKIKNKK